MEGDLRFSLLLCPLRSNQIPECLADSLCLCPHHPSAMETQIFTTLQRLPVSLKKVFHPSQAALLDLVTSSFHLEVSSPTNCISFFKCQFKYYIFRDAFQVLPECVKVSLTTFLHCNVSSLCLQVYVYLHLHHFGLWGRIAFVLFATPSPVPGTMPDLW